MTARRRASLSRTRWRVAATTGLAALVLSSALSATAGLAHADAGQGDPGLDLVSFIKKSDLTCGTGCTVSNAPRVLGVDPALHRLVLKTSDGLTLMLLDTSAPTLTQTDTISLGGFRAASNVLDPVSHTVFLASALQGTCQATPLPCEAGPTETPVQFSVVHLPQGGASATSSLYTLPSVFGQSVVAMTPMHAPDGRDVLLALTFRDESQVTASGALASMTLYALDVAKMDDTKPAAADAVLWSQPIHNCATTPSWSLSPNGSLPEFLGVTPGGTGAYFACRGTVPNGAVSPTLPSGAVVVDFPSAYPVTAPTGGFPVGFYAYGASTALSVSGGDNRTGRLFLASVGSVDKLYVFDAQHHAWVGSVPFETNDKNMWSIPTDPLNGRTYVVHTGNTVFGIQSDQVPVPQGRALSLGDLTVPGANGAVVDGTDHRLYIPTTGTFQHADGQTPYPDDDVVAVIQDTRPAPEQASQSDPDAQTHDVDLTPDIPVTYGGFASGYGTKAIIVGGIRSTAPGQDTPGGATPAGVAAFGCLIVGTAGTGAPCPALPNTSDGNRTVTLGQVYGTEASNSAAKAAAAPMTLDPGTSADAASLSSYDAFNDQYGQLTGGEAPIKRSDLPDPTAPASDAAAQQIAPATCGDFSDQPAQTATPGALATCDHAGDQAGGAAASSSTMTGSPVQVAYAASSTNTRHTAGNVTETAAVADARGIQIAIPGSDGQPAGTLRIGEVSTSAKSTAAGRKGTASSTFSRTVSDVSVLDASGTPVFACGFADGAPCDPRALTDALSAQTSSPVVVNMPSPDSTPSISGSPGGAQSEVIKDPYTWLNDFIVNGDDGFEVPGLQIVFVGDQWQPSRLVLNFAGVHVESHDAIGDAPPLPPELPLPSLELTLLDDATPPAPLSGATFTLTGPEGTKPLDCLTAADGIGTCKFDKLPAGSYTIAESEAPPGYAPVADYDLSLEPGKVYKTSFVNLPAIGSVKVDLSAPGDDAKPLEGGVFAMFKGDDVLGTPVATCTTDADGGCGFDKVPLGKYTMSQTTAPDGYLVTEDVPFEVAKPKQVVTLKIVDGTPGREAQPPVVIPGKPAVPPTVIPGKPAVPPKVIPGKPAVPPRTMVLPALDGSGTAGLDALEPASYDTSSVPPPMVSSQDANAMAPLQLGQGGLAAVPVRLARLAVHSPQQAVLLLFVWLVLGMPVYLWVRRRQFILETERV